MLYRTIRTDIWQDPWFVDLQPKSKCLFIFLFTNPRVTACGSMQISISQISFETKLTKKSVSAELLAFGDKISWWPDQNLIIVRNFYKHQRSQSSANFTIAAKKAMAELPKEAHDWLVGVYPDLLDGIPNPSPRVGFGETIPYPTQGDKEEATVSALAIAEGDARASTPPLPKPKRKDKLTNIPEDFTVTDDMRNHARTKHGFSDAEIDRRTEGFLNYVARKAPQYADWVAAWRNSLTWESHGVYHNGHDPRGAPPEGHNWDEVGDWRVLKRQGRFVPPEYLEILDQLDAKVSTA